MLLASGALTALAFTALPSVASATEPQLHCTSSPCKYTIENTGNSVFSTTDGDTILCTGVTGGGNASSLTGATGTVQLLFHGCKEQNTIFKFNCTGPGQPTGTVTTNEMVTHSVLISAGTPGVLLTGTNVTFSCAGGFSNARVTGDVIGHIETPNCNTAVTHQTLQFEATGHGQQKYKTTDTPGTWDLTSDKGEDTSYSTAAQTGTAHINWNQSVTLTC